MKISVFFGFCVFCDLCLCLLLAAVVQLRMPDGNNGRLAAVRLRRLRGCVLLCPRSDRNLAAALACRGNKQCILQ